MEIEENQEHVKATPLILREQEWKVQIIGSKVNPISTTGK